MGWVHLTLGNEETAHGGRTQPDVARFTLLFELEHSAAAQRALFELRESLRGSAPLAELAEPSAATLADLSRLLDTELEAGRIQLRFEPFFGVHQERNVLDIELPSRLPASKPTAEPSFIAVRLVDQTGKAVAQRPFRIELPDGNVHQGVTDPEGFGRVRGFVEDGTAKVTFLDVDELDLKTKNATASKRIIPVGATALADDAGKGGETLEPDSEQAAEFPEGDELARKGALGTPGEETGKLFVELFDKSGRVRHAHRTFQISGSASFEGKTDEQGRLQQEDVPIGDYTLSLALDFFIDGPDATVDIVDSPLVVLPRDAAEPQVRMIGAVPRSVLAELQLFFNTNKTFLLPSALPSVLQLRALYLKSSPCELLVVGHADTRGGTAFNDELALARAEATIAYLKDDVDGWFKFYSDADPKRKWGKTEDHLMLIALPDYTEKPPTEDEVTFFQRTRKLQKVDGKAGEETRKALIKEYMSLDGASLSDFVGDVVATAHGCGEHFPLDESGQNLDPAPVDQKRDRIDRRVELFLFDSEFGVTPKPPGRTSTAGSTEYPLWRQRVKEIIKLRAGDTDGPQVPFVEVSDAHFRLNSAVVLPEGERPDSKAHAALTSIGLMATVLRYNDEHPGRRVFVAGHTDTSAGDELNDELSRQRARVALALLEGDREAFAKLTQARHVGEDINQILSWVSEAFADLSFDCKPTSIGSFVSDAKVRSFQRDYNTNKSALGSTAADLKVDGSVGERTWGAFFDCYEHALREELGEDAAGLAGLRGKLVFADPERKSLGFGEHFPIEEVGVDGFRSETNRRVQIHLFTAGSEPDLAAAEQDPATSELYLPGRFAHFPLEPLVSAKPWRARWDAATTSMLEKRTLSVDAPGLPAGVSATVTVAAVGHGLAGVIQTVSQDGTITATFEDWDAMEGIQFLGDDPTFPAVDFTFAVEAGGRLATPVLPVRYEDRAFFQLLLRLPGGDQPLPQEPFVLSSPWGRVKGKTDDDALLDVKGLPPGGASVVIRGNTLAHFGIIELGADLDGS